MRPVQLSFISSSLLAFAHASTTVNIAAGILQGGSCPSVEANYFFKIPFAQPSVGDLRFASPLAAPTKFTSGTLNATTPTPPAFNLEALSSRRELPLKTRKFFTFRQAPSIE
jgi:hypothetical protein